MRALPIIAASLFLTSQVYAEDRERPLPRESWSGSAQAGLVMPGTLNVGDWRYDAGTGVMLLGQLESYLSGRFSLGGQLLLGSFTSDASGVTLDTALYGLGGVGKLHFGAGDLDIRPGLALSYEVLVLDADGVDPSHGVAVAGFCEGAYPMTESFAFLGQLGLMAYPYGRAGDIKITSGPRLYVAVGIEYGE